MTLGDAYATLKSGTLWSSTGRCKGFGVANPGEAAKIDAYVSQLELGPATAPVLTTATGRGIVGMLAALAPAADPPPPPPTGRRMGNGYLSNAQGSSYKDLTAAQHAAFGGTIVGYGDEANIVRDAPGKGLGYRTIVECGTPSSSDPGTQPNFVSIAFLRANNLVLKDAGGNEITNGAGLLMGDLGHPLFQAEWIRVAKLRHASTGLNAHFLDNVTGKIWSGWKTAAGVSVRPAKYPTDSDYTEAVALFLTAIRVGLPGTYLCANAQDAMPDRLSWWKRIAAIGIDGLLCEDPVLDAYRLGMLQAAQDAGRDAWMLLTDVASPTDPKCLQYAQAFESVWNGKGGGFGLWNGSWPLNPYWSSAIK